MSLIFALIEIGLTFVYLLFRQPRDSIGDKVVDTRGDTRLD
jgi:hypothetical protein